MLQFIILIKIYEGKHEFKNYEYIEQEEMNKRLFKYTYIRRNE